MREMEFLPGWYSQLEKRRRLLRLQVCLTLVLIAGLALWMVLADRNKRASAATLDTITGQLVQTDAQLAQMARMEAARRQCRQKADVLARLGNHVDSARIMGKLAEVIPANVSLSSVNLDVEETQVMMTPAQRAAQKDPNAVQLDRKLRARILGIAPTDVELATFLTELNRVPFLDDVTVNFARDRREAGHVLREFELVFSINLNAASGR